MKRGDSNRSTRRVYDRQRQEARDRMDRIHLDAGINPYGSSGSDPARPATRSTRSYGAYYQQIIDKFNEEASTQGYTKGLIQTLIWCYAMLDNQPGVPPDLPGRVRAFMSNLMRYTAFPTTYAFNAIATLEADLRRPVVRASDMSHAYLQAINDILRYCVQNEDPIVKPTLTELMDVMAGGPKDLYPPQS